MSTGPFTYSTDRDELAGFAALIGTPERTLRGHLECFWD